MATALDKAKLVAATLGVDAPVARASAACAALRAGAASCAPPPAGCLGALSGVYGELRAARPGLSPRRAAADDAVATEVFDVASRLALVPAALARGDCARIAAAGAHPTHMAIAGDGRTVFVRPLTALRAGRRYAVVARGVPAAEVTALRASLVPRPAPHGFTIPPDAFATEVAQGFPEDAGGIAGERAASFVGGLEKQAVAMPGLGAFSGVRVTLPEPLRAADVGTLQLAFVPAADAAADETLGTFAVLDARAGLLADRARLATLACDLPVAEPRDTKAVFGVHLPHVGRLLHGRFRSLDVTGDPSAAVPALGLAAADARPVELSYLLALPRDFGPKTPLVLVIDGHGGSAERILGKHADELTARGLAALSIDLPQHGERAVPGGNFVHALDPVGLGRNFRQAAVDVMAVLQAATRCGLPLPGGGRLRVPEARYFGYSIGAMTGAITRSVEPLLGTTVLVAPGGDILGWLMLRVTPPFGAQYVTCLGGPREGASCIDDGRCAAPGACIVDPFSERLCQLIALPYELAAAGGDPLSYATHHTGTASKGRLLVVTAGEDAALYPALATHLADAWGMKPVGTHRRRGPRSALVQWTGVGHELLGLADLRAEVVEFLASDGRHLVLPPKERRRDAPAPAR